MTAVRFFAFLVGVLMAGSAAGQGAPSALPVGRPIETVDDGALQGPILDRARAALGQGRVAEAEAAFRELLAAIERAHGAAAIETARAVGLLADFLDEQLRYSEAEPLWRRQNEILDTYYAARRTAGRNAEIAADAGRRGVDSYGERLAMNLTRQGRRDEADVIWARIRAARAAIGDTSWEPPEIGGRGSVIGVATTVPPERAVMEARRAEVGRLIDARRFAEAEALARTLPGGEIEPGDDFLLALALRGQSRWNDAAPLLERVVASPAARRSRLFRLDVLLALADNHLQRGDVVAAESRYRETADLYAVEFGPHYPDTLSVRQMVAYLLGQQGRYQEAADSYRQVCVGRIERARVHSRGSAVGSETASRTAEAAECGRRLANALRRVSLTGSVADDSALRDEAFLAAQVFQQSAAGDSLARAGARIAAAGAGAGDLAQRYEELLERRATLDVGERTAAASRGADRERLDAEIARLAVDLAGRDPRYWDLRSPQPIGRAELQTEAAGETPLLRDDEVLVAFIIPPGELRGLVFAVSRRGAAWADIPLTGDELATRVRALRAQIDPMGYGLGEPDASVAAVTPGLRVPFDRQAAWQLYQALFGDPAIQAVIRDPSTLIVVPSGPLTSLPPGLLVTAPPEGGAAANSNQAVLRRTPWLLRSKAIAVLPSVSALRTLRRLLPTAAPPSEPLLAFAVSAIGGGAPAPSGASTTPRLRALAAYFRDGRPAPDVLGTLPPLPGATREGLALANALDAPISSVLRDAEASEAELFARSADGRLARARVLAFATHGLLAGDVTGLAEPSLVLAGGATPDEALLTSSEIATLRINADWVLLSACHTASPDATGADGLSGLARAFFHAGGRSLLVSHWRVNDGIAPVLVPAIVAALQREPALTRAQALQRASLAILDNAKIPAAHPALWAPFTLVGEAGR